MPAYNYSSTAGEYTLTGGITSSATSITLNSVTGLPAVPFKVVLDPGLPSEEIVKVAAVAGTTLTVTRGWDSTAAVDHAALAKVRHMMTAEDLRLSRTHEDATTGVHGTTGTIVDTDTAQALTNKDLTSGTNSFPTSLVTLTGTQTLSNKTFSNTIDVPTGSVRIGTGASATQYAIRLQRQRTDAGAGDLRFALLEAGDAVAYLRKDATILNTFSLKQDGSTTTSGALTVGAGLTATTGTFSGAVSTGALTATSATVGDSAVTTASNTQTLSNKTLDSPTLTGTTAAAAVTATSVTIGGTPVPKIRHGQVNVTVPVGTASGTATVSLTGMGFTAPHVIAQVADEPASTSFFVAKVIAVTSTSFDVRVLISTGSTAGAAIAVRVDWIAVEG